MQRRSPWWRLVVVKASSQTAAVIATSLLAAACGSAVSAGRGAPSLVGSDVSSRPGSSAAPASPRASLSVGTSVPASSSPPASSSKAGLIASGKPAASSSPQVTPPPAGPCAAPFDVAAAATGLVPPSPNGALVCTYPSASDPRDPMPDELDAAQAGVLADIFDASPAAIVPCVTGVSAVVRFSYPSGRQADVRISGYGCSVPTASAGSRAVELNRSLATFITDDATAEGPGGSALPDVTGMSHAQAASVASRFGFTTDVEGQVVDAALAAGTVVMQFPPPGASRSPNTIGLLLSQQPAPACKPKQLTMDVNGVQHGTGDAFDDIQISDTSPAACTLRGDVRVVGVDAAGRAVTTTVSFVPAPDFVLTANTPPRLAAGDTIGQTSADLLLQASLSYGPNQDGSCTGHIVTPASWKVTLADASRTLPNGDGNPQTIFAACQGQLFPSSSTVLNPTP